MSVPGLFVENVFKRVRVGVVEESGGQQIPWEASSLMGDFYFRPKQAEPDRLPAPSQPMTPAAGVKKANFEILFWESIKDSNDTEMYKEYIRKFPNGIFSGLAAIKIRNLSKTSPKTRIAAIPQEQQKPAQEAAGVGHETDKATSIAKLEKKVRAIPAKDAAANLAGYRQLVILSPNNTRYKKKVTYYTAKVKETARSEEKTTVMPKTIQIDRPPPVEAKRAGSRMTLAIFPWKPADTYWNWVVVAAIEQTLKETELFDLAFSFYKVDRKFKAREITREDITSASVINYTDELWAKPSFWGKLEPRVDLITKIGNYLRVNAVLICNVDIQAIDPPSGNVSMYLINVRSGETFHVKGNTTEFDQNGAKLSTRLGRELFTKISRSR